MRSLILLSFLLYASPASAASEVHVSTSTRNSVEKALDLGLKTATTLTKDAFEFSKRLKRVAVELGAGEDVEIREVTDPFMPKGLERLFEWDMRLVVRNDGVGLRLNHLDPPWFRRVSLRYRLRFDPFDRAGLGEHRDNLYEGLGLNQPIEKRGYSFGLSAVRSAWWGYDASHDRSHWTEKGMETRDQVTEVGAGYSPLGDNPGRSWNWALVGGLNWEELVEKDNTLGVRTVRHGPGFKFGPTYQLGLDKHKLPWGLRPNRTTVRLQYADSQIHTSTIALLADVSAYATKALRLTFGVSETVGTRHGNTAFAVKFAASLILDFRKFHF